MRPEWGRNAGLACACAAAAVGALVASLSPAGGTYAALSDSFTTHNEVGAGVWRPDPPAECGDPSQYAGVVYGTAGNDVLIGGNRPQILMGLGGNDTLRGGNAGDCLVGGDGDDKLYGGNAKDILLGGDGDDLLDGGNGKDVLDGGAGTADTCLGGNGKNVLVSCERAAP
jgi:Ca2+-binding RTX toxin-like protein